MTLLSKLPPARTLVVAALALAAIFLGISTIREAGDSTGTDYQAVQLTNGSVFYGRLSRLGSTYLRLEDPFTIEKRFDPDAGKENSILTGRKDDWHAPAFVLLNRQHVVTVEPITYGSRVWQLIRLRPKPRTQTKEIPNVGSDQ
jgi:hypothetical protein